MENTGVSQALVNINENRYTYKKSVKKLSNAFCVPLLLQQAYGAVVLLISALIVMLIRVVFLKEVSGFSLNTFYSFMSQSSNSDVLNNVFYDFTYLAFMFIPFIIIAAVLKQNPIYVIPMKIRHKELILPAIVFGLFFSIAGEFYAGYFQSILQFFGLQVQLSQFSFPNNTPALILYFIQLSILAPLCEEFVFRGLILQNLRKYGNFFAVLMSSLMFGIIHGNLSQTPFAFIVGIALAVIVIETGSIWVSVLIHCLINSISLLSDGITYYHKGNLSNNLYILYMLAILALTVIISVNLYKKRFFKNALRKYTASVLPAPAAAGAYVKTPGFIIFIILYIIIMISSLSPIGQ